MKSYGLIVGKFSPLHTGHEWFIEEAATQCDQLLILSYSNPEFEHCSVENRTIWLNERFPKYKSIVIDQEWVNAECYIRGIEKKQIPSNSDSNQNQQEFLGWLLKEVLVYSVTKIFSSEYWGPSCADVLSEILHHDVESVIIDAQRVQVTVSASQIRADPFSNQHFMSKSVYAKFAKRIVLLGGESTGKTVLAEALATGLNTTWIPEYGRQLWLEKSGNFTIEDLIKIAIKQISLEDNNRNANQYLICDTSPLTTAGYSQWMFGYINLPLSAMALRSYDAVVLCEPDFPFVQDETRQNNEFRMMQQQWYKEKIAQMNCPVCIVRGSVSERVKKVCEWLKIVFEKES